MAISMSGGAETPMSDINTTPLVDVMLVLLIIFLIAVPVAIQTIEKLEIPVLESIESKDKVENLLLTVSTTDANGLSAGEPGFEGASRNGQCRVYFNNITFARFPIFCKVYVSFYIDGSNIIRMDVFNCFCRYLSI